MVKSGLKILLDALKGQGLTNPDDFQVGKTKLFMRDKQVRPFIAFLLCALPWLPIARLNTHCAQSAKLEERRLIMLKDHVITLQKVTPLPIA